MKPGNRHKEEEGTGDWIFWLGGNLAAVRHNNILDGFSSLNGKDYDNAGEEKKL